MRNILGQGGDAELIVVLEEIGEAFAVRFVLIELGRLDDNTAMLTMMEPVCPRS